MSNSRERASTFFELACQYKNAADLLSKPFELGTTKLPIREPIYFLYHHAVELVLKAFLTSRSKTSAHLQKLGHRIEALYEESRKEGLIVKEDDNFEVRFLISRLAAGNQDHFYRYPVENKRISSEPTWTRDVVGRLLEAVEPFAKNLASPALAHMAGAA